MTEQEKMLAGDLYFPSDKTLSALRKQCRMQLDELNTTCQSDHKKRTRLLKGCLVVLEKGFTLVFIQM